MEALFIGIAAAFNFIIIKWKLEHRRMTDALVDIAIGSTLIITFMGTLSGMTIAMIASVIVSLYLLAFPPKWSTA